MRNPLTVPGFKAALSLTAVAVLAGCASVNLEQTLEKTNAQTGDFTAGRLSLAQTDQQRDDRQQAASKLLTSVVGQKEAVQLALVNSPSMQAMLAQSWADSSLAAQSGRIANPVFSFERVRAGEELEFGRILTFGLLDLITLPYRKGIADQRIEQSQIRLAAEVVDRTTQVRQSWVRAVAAKQSLAYAKQVYENAEAGAELARRLEAVGNFNKLSRARQQTFYADAATRLSAAHQQEISAREDLIRLLGLDDKQATQLRLPDRLPDLPKQARQPAEVAKAASNGRLDIQLAQSALNVSAKAQGLETINSFTDIELGVRRDTVFDNGSGAKSNPRGYEIDLRLPIFDWGGMRRDAMTGQTLAAANQLEAVTRAAGSHLRESYSAYRTAYDIARHHRDEVVPLRRAIADENLLRYNGMLIGVFELLADSRDQVSTVMAAINAEQQFWLADANLQASLVGRPTGLSIASPAAAQSGGAEGH
jgi:outer membrane protein TolC